MTKNILELGVDNDPATHSSGAVWHDWQARLPEVEYIWDLDQFPWPWRDEQFTKIVALDVVEHLKADVFRWLNECHRILQPGGELLLRIRNVQTEKTDRDPGHRRTFAADSFDAWVPGTARYNNDGKTRYAAHNRWWSKWRGVHIIETGNLYFTLVKQ